MNRIFKTAILSAAIAATTLATLPAANADEWRHHRRHHHGDALAAGVLGLAAGALIVGALNNPQPSYYDPGYDDYDGYARPAPVRRYYAQPKVVYADRRRAVDPRMVRVLLGPLPDLQCPLRNLHRQ